MIEGARLLVGHGPWVETTGSLYHELVHIMGLTYHPNDLYSILDHVPNTDDLKSADKELLALLYNRRLVPGMAHREALRTTRGILSGRGADESPL